MSSRRRKMPITQHLMVLSLYPIASGEQLRAAETKREENRGRGEWAARFGACEPIHSHLAQLIINRRGEQRCLLRDSAPLSIPLPLRSDLPT